MNFFLVELSARRKCKVSRCGGEVSRTSMRKRETCKRLKMATAQLLYSVYDNVPLVCRYCIRAVKFALGEIPDAREYDRNKRIKGYGMYREIVFVKSYILTNKRMRNIDTQTCRLAIQGPLPSLNTSFSVPPQTSWYGSHWPTSSLAPPFHSSLLLHSLPPATARAVSGVSMY